MIRRLYVRARILFGVFVAFSMPRSLDTYTLDPVNAEGFRFVSSVQFLFSLVLALFVSNRGLIAGSKPFF